MKLSLRQISWLFFLFLIYLTSAADLRAETLFSGRQIFLNNDRYSVFRIGVTGTTAGYNYLALIEGAKQESVALGELGYWELVADPPSSLRNYDLQLTVENNYDGNFQIEFTYNKNRKNIEYRITEGTIQVKLDDSTYYPTLIIEGITSVAQMLEEGILGRGSSLLFFDFNSFDVDLRKHYGSIKKLLDSSDSNHYFYYYEAGDYNSYYFKTYRDVAELDTDKMGLSLEDGSLGYYQKILDNLKSRFGTKFADRVIIVSRFGDQFSKELKEYAYEIGLGKDMEVTFWSYDQIK